MLQRLLNESVLISNTWKNDEIKFYCSYQRASENVTRSQEAIEKLARENKPFDQIQKGQGNLLIERGENTNMMVRKNYKMQIWSWRSRENI